MAERPIDSKTNSGYAAVNGLKLYYETYGAKADTGRPLILLHGAFGEAGTFAGLLPALTPTRQVIAVELQAHGHTADIDRPLRFEAMADDVAALIGHLGFEQADVLGYSLGGGVALQTAIRHPQVVGKLVVISAVCKRSGWYPETAAGMAAVNADAARMWVGTPMHAAYIQAAPRPEDWPALATKLGQLLSQDYDWCEDFAALQAPALIVAGDADGIRTAHAVEMFELLGGGKKDGGWDGSGMSNARLAILPGVTHLSILSSPLLGPAVASFLAEPMPAAG
jgi:pimeloyl-ACP methyl ester carboxylesterase